MQQNRAYVRSAILARLRDFTTFHELSAAPKFPQGRKLLCYQQLELGLCIAFSSWRRGGMSNMVGFRSSKNLANEIGLYRIALVVHAVHEQMKTQSAFKRLFNVTGSDDDQKARLTYFWWVVLGGNKLSDCDWQVIRQDAQTGVGVSAFRDWLALFRQTALPIIGPELTGAWMLRAAQLSHRFAAAREADAMQLAQAS
jgi:truncated hemoglobin YjbI